jgi:hypothetical protein
VFVIGQHFELHTFEFFKREFFEQCPAGCSEIMLNGIGEGEEIATGAFESVAERNQFLPAIDSDEPAVIQIAPKFFRFDTEIDNVRVGPDKRMKWLYVGDCRSICFPTMHPNGAAFA